MDEGSPVCLQDARCPSRQIAPSPPRRGTVDRAEWLADKLHNGGDYGKEAAALLVHQAKELDYLRAARENRKPAWVPARVWLAGPVRGDYPIGHTTIAHEGEYECQSNRYGAVSVIAENGKWLGVKPSEFEVAAWRENKA
jgi:hypothetical protein